MDKLIILPNIKDINYTLIEEYNNKCNELNKITDDGTIRLEPPYEIPCCKKANGCQKDAGFLLLNDSNYYCWYHMHSKLN